MSRFAILFLASLAAVFGRGASSAAGTSGELDSIAACEAHFRMNPSSKPIDATIEGVVVRCYFNFFILKEETNTTWVFFRSPVAAREGDRIRCRAKADFNLVNNRVFLTAKDVHVLSHGEIPPAVPATLGEVATGEMDFRPCTVQGVITDVERDEIGAEFLRLTLEDGKTRLIALIFSTNRTEAAAAKALLDHTVSVSGIGYPPDVIHRTPGSYLLTDAAARFIPIADDNTHGRTPHRITETGRVITCWHRAFFLQTPNGQRLRVHLEDDSPMPRPNDSVTVRGFRRNYPFFPRLMSALVSPGPADVAPLPQPLACSARQILLDDRQQPQLNRKADGQLVTLEGTISEMHRTESGSFELTLETDGYRIPVLFSELTPPPVGAMVRLSGACLLSVRDDETDLSDIHLKGFTLIPRAATDVTILAAPPWWTAPRLLIILTVLSIVALFSLIGNVLLRRLAERRGHQLAQTELSRARSELKKTERTRLAVELHDSLSQNLTGIVLQLDASRHARETDVDASDHHLQTAMRMLQGCRTELRRCITDLRSSILDLPDFEDAIRLSLHPIVDTTKLQVRSHIPRVRLGDDVAHAVLRIVRELVANAIRHGQATAVRIAGDISTGQLKFSVTDDGCGFPTDAIPGPEEGHFGLTGIRERLRELKGTLSIKSVHPHGAKVTFVIPSPDSTT